MKITKKRFVARFAGWHRLVVVCDGSTSTFYVDGTSVGSGAASDTDIYTVGNQPLGNTVSVQLEGRGCVLG